MPLTRVPQGKGPNGAEVLEAVRARSAFHLHEGCGGYGIAPLGVGDPAAAWGTD